MFSKSLFLFAFLAFFACQGAQAHALYSSDLERKSIGELIDEVKEIIKNIDTLVHGIVHDALGSLTDALGSITDIKDGLLNGIIGNLTHHVGDIVKNITDQVGHAAELGIDVAQCVVGPLAHLDKLIPDVTSNITDTVTGIVDDALHMVNEDLHVVNEIVSNATNIPKRLTKCLVSWQIMKCVTDLLSDVSTLLKNLPGQIKDIIANTDILLGELPQQISNMTGGIVNSTIGTVDGILTNVTTCINETIANNSASTTTETSQAFFLHY